MTDVKLKEEIDDAYLEGGEMRRDFGIQYFGTGAEMPSYQASNGVLEKSVPCILIGVPVRTIYAEGPARPRLG